MHSTHQPPHPAKGVVVTHSRGRIRRSAIAVLSVLALAVAAAPAAAMPAAATRVAALPVGQMEAALHAKGTVSSGVLSVSLDRDDIGNAHIHGVVIKPSFEINGDMTFQRLANGRALFNGDIALKPNEVNRFIDAIFTNGLTFQAEHQHFYDLNPPIWFIHFRGTGTPVALASAVHNVLATTSTPFPQKPPAKPTTPLDPKKLQAILHGYSSSVGADGVVTVLVARKNPIRIGGIVTKPDTNIATNVAFEPLTKAGTRVAAAPDFSLEAGEVNNVIHTMRAAGWDIGCLYNQETAEHPQLYFSHDFKVGDAYQLAREIRAGLDQMNVH
jgi:hypothetical protein